MQVRDVMTTEVVTVTASASLREVARTLAAHGVSGLPVIAADGAVLGVVSEADVLAKERRVAEPDGRRWRFRRATPAPTGKHEARIAAEAMTAPAITIPPFASIATAAERMLDHGVNRLPVIGRGRLVGIVARADLVRAFARTDDEIAAEAAQVVELQQAMLDEPGTLSVRVTEGDALVTGAVRRRSDAEIVSHLVRHVPGVVEVRSEITWNEDA